MALVSVSTTTAITSIASSFDKRHPASGASAPLCFGLSALLSQDSRPGGRHRHRVLKMSAHASVFGHCRPAVIQHQHGGLAGIHHGRDGDHHSGLQLHTPAGFAKVRHLRILVHMNPDTVAHKIPYHRKSLAFHNPFHSSRNTPHSTP